MTYADIRDACIARWGVPRVDWLWCDRYGGACLWFDDRTVGLYGTVEGVCLFGAAWGETMRRWPSTGPLDDVNAAMDAADDWRRNDAENTAPSPR